MARLKSITASTALGAGLVWCACVGSASAEPAFVGTWARTKSGCLQTQDKPGAPLILTTRTYDQHEGHCTFPPPKGNGPSWSLKATCSIDGDKQTHTFLVQTLRGKLSIRESGAANKLLVRCATRARY